MKKLLLLLVPLLLLVGCEGSDELNRLMEQKSEEQARIKEAREKAAQKALALTSYVPTGPKPLSSIDDTK